MRPTLILLLLLYGCAAPFNVRGLVKDTNTGSPLKAALVEIGGLQTSTDHRGLYELVIPYTPEAVPIYVSTQSYHSYSEFRSLQHTPGSRYTPMNFGLLHVKDTPSHLSRAGYGHNDGDKTTIVVGGK